MGKPSPVVAEIAALVVKSGRSLPWWERVTPEIAETLPEVLKGWHDGRFGPHRRPAAQAIAAWLQQNGVQIGHQGVLTWLERNARQ
jgi:aromatic ring-cleaving dioxygenase